MRVREFVAFIKEREKVRIAKESGKPRPWTTDPILDKYRFCNVHREHDRVSRWLRDNWYPRFAGNPDIWFAAIVARLLNLPDSLAEVRDCILPWKPRDFARVLHHRKLSGLKNFNAAYIVSTNGVAMEKVDYLVERVLTPLWKARKQFNGPQHPNTLESWHRDFMCFDGLGSFIAAQVVADLKYMEPWQSAPDWWTFASSGPGSRRGLNRVFEWPVDKPWNEASWRVCLVTLAGVSAVHKLGLHAQDLQNCLCEFDKYERALDGGAPKQIYKENVDAR